MATASSGKGKKGRVNKRSCGGGGDAVVVAVDCLNVDCRFRSIRAAKAKQQQTNDGRGGMANVGGVESLGKRRRVDKRTSGGGDAVVVAVDGLEDYCRFRSRAAKTKQQQTNDGGGGGGTATAATAASSGQKQRVDKKKQWRRRCCSCHRDFLVVAVEKEWARMVLMMEIPSREQGDGSDRHATVATVIRSSAVRADHYN